jgi:hypothetical protein
MRSDARFAQLDPAFWANVRSVSQELGYVRRGAGEVATYALQDIVDATSRLGLQTSHLIGENGAPTVLALSLRDYFAYRSDVLNGFVQPRLMNAKQARDEFLALKKALRPSCPLPMNKQKGKKKTHAFLSCIVNMLIEAHKGETAADYDPRRLVTVTKAGRLVRTPARRFDGCLPGTVDPVAVWETKEYYHTTTFGSRVADGIYETLLDGMELRELREQEGAHVRHYLMLDGRFTWWDCGKSYLCRVVDMLNMGYVDEVLFGREVMERLPRLVEEWLEQLEPSPDQ